MIWPGRYFFGDKHMNIISYHFFIPAPVILIDDDSKDLDFVCHIE